MRPDDLERMQEALAASAEELAGELRGQDRRDAETRGGLEVRLTRLSRAAVANVPGVDFAGLTLCHRAGLSSHGPSHPEITELDRLQARLGEGPCVDAVTPGTASLVEVADFAEESSRWPRFAPAAVQWGIGSLLSYAMAPQDEVPGAVNLYSRARGGFGADTKVIAGAFATQAAIAVYGARRIDNLEHAVASRDLIGQAKGILMERYRIDAAAAFDRLVAASQHANIKLVDVAGWLTTETESAART